MYSSDVSDSFSGGGKNWTPSSVSTLTPVKFTLALRAPRSPAPICFAYSTKLASRPSFRLSSNWLATKASNPIDTYRRDKNGTDAPGSANLGRSGRSVLMLSNWQSFMSPSLGKIPQTSNKRTDLVPSSASPIHFEITFCRSLGLGTARPQPSTPARSLPVPRGICTSAGKYSFRSWSVQANSSASLISTLNTQNKAKDAVPSPPPQMSLGRLSTPSAILAAASARAWNSSQRNTAMTLGLVATCTMSKNRRRKQGNRWASRKMGSPAWPPDLGFRSPTNGGSLLLAFPGCISGTRPEDV
mmetsp:Transcript_87162/g.233414  ORF Transcript_87162/g.233414 Transcript_87162/m.233414 type:complete len:300 (+) Transcript_87162:1353-2252(+)